jgi:hypothetical protein
LFRDFKADIKKIIKRKEKIKIPKDFQVRLFARIKIDILIFVECELLR